ncbi:sugar phosphate isomerase/epimerase [Actinoplanes sp. NPDC026670]|uniref:sugar phosphate isomerase/epimerase family protein n=1 Tax=Actinoplanes sp. NPDC026670 TaxID=3154700 RepID=UPI0033E7D41F
MTEHAARSPRLSVQLYSVRDQLAADLDGTLARLAALGIDAVEPYTVFDRPDELAAALARHGLAAPTAHAPLLSDQIEYQGHLVPLPPPAIALEAARAVGAHVVFDPMTSPQRWRTPADVAATAARLNAAAETAAGFGLRVGHHNHSFEFHQRFDDVSAYEYFVSLLDESVLLEVDLYWAALAGQDLPALLQRLGSRVHAVHVKDGSVVADPFVSAASYDAVLLGQRPVGAGELGVAAALDVAGNVPLHVIEFDHAADPLTAIGESVRYLRERAMP